MQIHESTANLLQTLRFGQLRYSHINVEMLLLSHILKSLLMVSGHNIMLQSISVLSDCDELLLFNLLLKPLSLNMSFSPQHILQHRRILGCFTYF